MTGFWANNFTKDSKIICDDNTIYTIPHSANVAENVASVIVKKNIDKLIVNKMFKAYEKSVNEVLKTKYANCNIDYINFEEF